MKFHLIVIVSMWLALMNLGPLWAEPQSFHDGPNNVTVTLNIERFNGAGDYWRLTKIVYQDSSVSGGQHLIKFELIDQQGKAVAGQTVWQGWPDGQAPATTGSDGKANFGMYAKFWPPEQGPYRGWVDGPSDVVHGMGLTCGHHVNFILYYQKARRSDKQLEAAYLPNVPQLSGPLNSTKEGPSTPVMRYSAFKQWDSRWGNNAMNYHYTQSYKIKDWGCAITSFGSAVGTDPGTLNEWLSNHNGYVPDANVVWSTMGSYAGKTLQGVYSPSAVSAAYIRSCLDANKIVIAMVRFSSHYVLLTGHDGGNKFYCHDPYFNDTWYLYNGEGTNDHIDYYVIYY